MWILDGRKFKNKAELWNSKDEWNFLSSGTSIAIFNFSKTKCLTTSHEGDVIEDDRRNALKNGKAQQSFLWNEGKPDTEGYFTLKNVQTPKFLTGTSEGSLKIKGNSNNPYSSFTPPWASKSTFCIFNFYP